MAAVIRAEEIFKTILNSKWAKSYNGEVQSFFPAFCPIRYGLYSSALDRFIAVDYLDLWSMRTTAQILSSKFISTVCIFSMEEPPFKLHDCMLWTLTDKSAVLPTKQTPSLHRVLNKNELMYAGISPDFSADPQKLVEEQEFILFVLRSVVALRLTEISLGFNSEVKNDNQKHYLTIAGLNPEVNGVSAPSDRTKWAGGFICWMSALLSRAWSINEVLTELETVMSEDDQGGTAEDVIYRKIYIKNFRKFLAGET